MSLLIDIAQQRQRVVAGKIARREAEVGAQQEELSAISRETDRKERLADALASQNASAGASGITFEGSPFTILQEDIRREQVATRRDIFQSQLSASITRQRGLVAEKQGRAAANIGLIRAITERAS